MEIHIVIPARFASTRLPGKPLADIAGEPMIVRVAAQAARSMANDVVVAVDDERVAAAVVSAGWQAEMTERTICLARPGNGGRVATWVV